MTERLADSTAQGLVGTDEHGRITLFSEAAERLFGHGRSEVMGRRFDQVLVPVRLRDASRSGFQRILAGGAPRVLGRAVRAPVLTSDGEECVVAMTLLEAGTPPTRFVACFGPETGWMEVPDETEGARRALLAHRTVNRALDAWGEPRGGVAGVIRTLVREMGWQSGAMWQPRGDPGQLHRQVFWRCPAREDGAMLDPVSPAGGALPAEAWRRGEVVIRGVGEIGKDTPPEVAIPVIVDGRPLAVLHFQASPSQVPTHEMREALTEIGRGRLADFFGRHRAELGLSPLTDREQQVLQLAADGGAISVIAGQLGISPSTVKTHFEHIYEKLKVSDRGGAVAEGFRRGLVS